jgi:hypothetical protein
MRVICRRSERARDFSRSLGGDSPSAAAFYVIDLSRDRQREKEVKKGQECFAMNRFLTVLIFYALNSQFYEFLIIFIYHITSCICVDQLQTVGKCSPERLKSNMEQRGSVFVC